jgi:Uncharacterized protein conserved in bacteria (DUF2252)
MQAASDMFPGWTSYRGHDYHVRQYRDMKGSAHSMEGRAMATKLNDSAYQHAQGLIKHGACVLDQRDDWSDHQPSSSKENSFIQENGWEEYQKWHLAIDDEEGENTKARYKFPYGDFEKVHRCGVISAESRAGQYKYRDVETAAHHLHDMLDELG